MRFLAHRSTWTVRAGTDARALPRLQPRYHRPRAGLAGIAAAALACAALGTWGSAAQAAPTLLISGAGFGHGVGMSQEGALGYAQHGYDYAAILAHYYTGTALGRVPSDQTVRILLHGKVRRMPLEAYVRGVVGAEMPPDWPLAALEAQAIASRTYALTDHAGGVRFDVYADTRSQLYLGARAQTAQTNAAVAATAGQIVTYAGRPAITYFFASSGSATEDVQNGFPGAEPEPWLRGVPDPYDQGPQHRWSTSMSFAAAARRLRGLVHGSFRGIEVVRRGYSPRILSAYVLGSGGPTPVSGPELANRLGLYDDWAYFSVRSAHAVRPEPDLSGPATPPSASQEPSPAIPASGPGGSYPSAGTSAAGAQDVSLQGGAEGPVGPVGGTQAG